jgi:D-sedoheptulose 7-phosphate isomerase
MKDEVIRQINESCEVKQKVADQLSDKIRETADLVVKTFGSCNKVMLCGNGGSAAQCQHIADEFINKYKKQRKALPAISLTTDTSNLTAIGNDINFNAIFSKQIEALGNEGDLLFALSTSGNSKNVLQAIDEAKKKGMKIIGLTGESGGEMADKCDILLNVPSKDTGRIQESHITILHIICDIVEMTMFP